MVKKICLVSQLVIDVLAVAAVFIVSGIMSFDIYSYRISLWIIMGLGLFNALFIAIEEFFVKDYQAKKFSLIIHALYAMIDCGLYYAIGYFDYEPYMWLWLLLFYLSNVLVVLILTILNYKIKDKKSKIQYNANRRG